MTEQLIDQGTLDRLPRLLLVMHEGPSRWAGATILMQRLFSIYPADRLWLLTSTQGLRRVLPFDPIPAAPYRIAVPHMSISTRLPILRPVNTGALTVSMLRTVVAGVGLVRQKRIQAIFSFPHGPFFLIAYCIHKITGRPFYSFIMDDQLPRYTDKRLAAPLYRWLIPRLLHSLQQVWTISVPMQQYFLQEYGILSTVLLPFGDVRAFQLSYVPLRQEHQNHVNILFTGAVYGAQADALRRLVNVVNSQALASEGAPRHLTLTMYTFAQEQHLRNLGLCGPNVQVRQAHIAEMPGVLSQADILFLPLSFEAQQKHTVQTSFPTKMAEYLPSGVPLLVHAPAYSSVSKYCREHQVGLVVDEPDERALCQAVQRLVTDETLRATLSANATRIAGQNHDRNVAVATVLTQIAATC